MSNKCFGQSVFVSEFNFSQDYTRNRTIKLFLSHHNIFLERYKVIYKNIMTNSKIISRVKSLDPYHGNWIFG